MESLSIKSRLLCLMAFSAAVTLVVAVMAWKNNDLAYGATSDLTETTIAARGSMLADMMHDAIRADVLSAQLAALSQDKSAMEDAQKELQEHIDTMKESLRTVSEGTRSAAVQSAIQSAVPVVDRYAQQANASVQAIRQDPKQAGAAVERFLVAFGETEEALESSGDAIEAAASEIKARTTSELERYKSLTAAVIGMCFISTLAFTILVTRSIIRPINRMRAAAASLNADDGDLSRRFPPATAEFAELVVLFNRFLDKVSGVVCSVQSSAHQISTTSEQIAAGNLDLTKRNVDTAVALQQAASSMEQITATVQQSTESARQASQYAMTASDVAAKGGEAVSRVVSTMDEINVASRKISDIIGVIDGIAFQTNILALNAAVEAARAGEQGRGFAVVASEVRSLAQRSAEAAREIKALIGTSVEKVDLGAALVRSAGATMDEIVASVSRVSTMIQEITQAAAEQSIGISQVSGTVVDLDRKTKEDTAFVEQAAAIANQMSDQAMQLEKTINVFKSASEVA